MRRTHVSSSILKRNKKKIIFFVFAFLPFYFVLFCFCKFFFEKTFSSLKVTQRIIEQKILKKTIYCRKLLRNFFTFVFLAFKRTIFWLRVYAKGLNWKCKQSEQRNLILFEIRLMETYTQKHKNSFLKINNRKRNFDLHLLLLYIVTPSCEFQFFLALT
jgi:hypothetical protein